MNKVYLILSFLCIYTDSSPAPRGCPGCDEITDSSTVDQEAQDLTSRSENQDSETPNDDPWDHSSKPAAPLDRKQMFWQGVWDSDKTPKKSHEGSLHHGDHHDPLVMLEKTVNKFGHGHPFSQIIANAIIKKRSEVQNQMKMMNGK